MTDMRAINWLLGGDTGTSSKCICRVLSGSTIQGRWCDDSLPRDADDFGRCHRLLQQIPEWRARLHEVGEKVPTWGPLVAAWDELTALYEAYIATPDLPQRARYDAYAPLGRRLFALEQEGYLAAGWIKTGHGCWKRPEVAAHV